MAAILVADDDGHIREVVRYALDRAGHTVYEAADGQAALARLTEGGVDAVVLDIVMPELDGLEVCRRLRALPPPLGAVPVLFLSSRDDELDRVLGLELGGDDYVTKPFSPRELVARLKAMLRRVQQLAAPPPADSRDPELCHGPLRLDPARHRAWWRDAELVFTVTEFNLLATLMRRPGQVYTRDAIVDRVWGPGHAITDRTIDSHIRRIRKKLADEGGDVIETVYGLGYRLRERP